MRTARQVVVLILLIACRGAPGQTPSQPAGATPPNDAPRVSASPGGYDSRIAAARRFVEQSSRYLHHGRLSRGMTGYGLTVLAGTEIVRFDVEIVSVDVGRVPGRDVILARISGHDLDVSGVIAGMSGSPIFVHTPEGDRMVGALAYGYYFQKPLGFGPLCGIQPITQMLAAAGIGSPFRPATRLAERRGSRDAARFMSALSKTGGPAFEKAAAAISFGTLDRGDRSPDARAGLRPLPLPLSAPGTSRFASRLKTLGVESPWLPVEMAGASTAPAAAATGQGAAPWTPADLDGDVRLAPGSTLVVPMVTGDVNYTSLGTVTDVVDGTVIGFGHPMFGRGRVNFPMGTGYVHTVVAGMDLSFKSGCLLKVTGALTADDYAAVSGRQDKAPAMIPMTLRVERPASGSVQQFHFNLIDDWDWTWWMAALSLSDCIYSISDIPKLAHVEYKLMIDFEGFEPVEIANMSSMADDYAPAYDIERWIWTMMDNPFGGVSPRAIEVEVRILPGERISQVVSAVAERRHYRPGDSVTLAVAFRDYHQNQSVRKMRFDLPADLPAGDYTIAIGNAASHLSMLRERRPRFFAPRNMTELYDLLSLETSLRADVLYLSMERPTAGMTIDQQSVERLPATVADMLAAGDSEFITPHSAVVTGQISMDAELFGSTSVTFSVSDGPLPR